MKISLKTTSEDTKILLKEAEKLKLHCGMSD